MSQVNAQQLLIAKEKFRKTYLLLKASVEKLQRYDPKKVYSADELEPYDALSDPFIRTVEVAIKYFTPFILKNRSTVKGAGSVSRGAP